MGEIDFKRVEIKFIFDFFYLYRESVGWFYNLNL